MTEPGEVNGMGDIIRELQGLGDEETHTGAAITETEERLATSRQALGEVHAARIARAKVAVNVWYAQAEDGTLQGEDLLQAAEQLTSTINHPPHVADLRAFKELRSKLEPGTSVYVPGDDGIGKLFHLADHTQGHAPRIVAGNRPRLDGSFLPRVQLAYEVAVLGDTKGVDTIPISNRSATFGKDEIIDMIEEGLNRRDSNAYRLEQFGRAISVVIALGDPKKVAEYRDQATKLARQLTNKHNRLDVDDWSRVLAYLEDFEPDELRRQYNEAAKEIATGNITWDLERKSRFVDAYIRVKNTKFTELPQAAQNTLFLQMLTAMHEHGANLIRGNPPSSTRRT